MFHAAFLQQYQKSLIRSVGWFGVFLLAAFALQNPSSSSSFGFIPKIKGWFKPPVATTPVKEIVKVVTEESQVIDVVKKSTGAVVSIIASADVPRMVQCTRQFQGFEGMDLPPEFRGMFDIPALCQDGTEKKKVGAGTGFLVSADGYIVTNKHVVANEKGEYMVVLNDAKHLGQRMKARVLARAPSQDIALLKIDATALPFLPLGDSSKLQVGQTAIAIGYSLGEFDNTVSKGVVSGLSRSIDAGGGGMNEHLTGLIQTDAAINPGNSGGPLLDLGGSVIGMNTAMANAQSIGFAIPINEIKASYEQVKKEGKITEPERAFLGVRYVMVTPELKEKLKLKEDYGVLISRGPQPEDAAVVVDSPADKAGLRDGDQILEIDGKKLNERVQLADLIAQHKPGDEVEIRFARKDVVLTLKVKLEKKK